MPNLTPGVTHHRPEKGPYFLFNPSVLASKMTHVWNKGFTTTRRQFAALKYRFLNVCSNV